MVTKIIERQNLLSTSPKSNSKDLLITAVILLGLILAAWTQTLSFANHDAIWLLHCAHMILMGGQYYNSFFDANPPLVLFLYMPAFLLAKFFSISVYHGLVFYLFVLISLSVFISYRLLREQFVNNLFAMSFVVFIMTIVFAILPFLWFSERDHLSVVFILPYLFWLSLDCQNGNLNKKSRFFVSVLAAVGFSLKPYFVLPWIFVELYYLSRKGFRHILRLESITIISFMVLYVLLTWWFFPTYFSKILPVTLMLFTPGNQRVSPILLPYYTAFMLPPFLLLLWHLSLTRYRDLNAILLLANVAYYCVFVYQRNLWYYHLYPNIAITLISLALLIAEMFSAMQTLKRQKSTTEFANVRVQFFLGVLFFLLLIFTAINLNVKNFRDKADPNSMSNRLISFVKTNANQQPITVISLNFAQEFVRHYTNAVIVDRFPNMQLIPGLQLLAMQGKKQEYVIYKDKFFKLFLADLEHNPPKYIFISTKGYWIWWRNQAQFFPFLPFLQADETFVKFFNRYQYLQTITGAMPDGSLTAYEVYVRRKVSV